MFGEPTARTFSAPVWCVDANVIFSDTFSKPENEIVDSLKIKNEIVDSLKIT